MEKDLTQSCKNPFYKFSKATNLFNHPFHEKGGFNWRKWWRVRHLGSDVDRGAKRNITKTKRICFIHGLKIHERIAIPLLEKMGSAFHLYARVSKQKDASTLQNQNRFSLFSREYMIEYGSNPWFLILYFAKQ